MSNQFLNTDEITLEALDVLENQLGFTKTVRRKYDSYFAKAGAKIGDTLRVRKPARYLGSYGQGWSPEAITETYTTVALDRYFKVHMEMTTEDLTLKIDEFSDRILKPAVARIANKIDQDGLEVAARVSQSVGTPGTSITTLGTFLNAGVKLDNAAARDDGERNVAVDPQTQANLVNGLYNIFNPQTDVSRQNRKGAMGTAANLKFGKDQNIYRQTVGTLTGATPLVNGAGQGASGSIITDGWSGSSNTLNEGDVIQFAGVYSINPQAYMQTSTLMDFRVTATATSAGGAMTITFEPAMITSGAFQNVSNLPADNAAITVYGVAAASFGTISGVSYPVNIAYHPDFITLVSADLYMPNGVDQGSRKSDDQLGISIRYTRDWDPVTDKLMNRLDVLYGWHILRPELACRVAAA